MLLPIINVTGAWFAKAINRRVRNEPLTAVIFFAIAAVFLLLLRLFGSSSLVLSLVSMAVVTNCMFAINVMYITIVPLHFSKNRTCQHHSGFFKRRRLCRLRGAQPACRRAFRAPGRLGSAFLDVDPDRCDRIAVLRRRFAPLETVYAKRRRGCLKPFLHICFRKRFRISCGTVFLCDEHRVKGGLPACFFKAGVHHDLPVDEAQRQAVALQFFSV